MILAFWLILAAIFAHAVLPVGSPMTRMPGSAFSAATFDVSLAPSRNSASTFLAQREGPKLGLGGSDPAPPPAAILPASGPAFAFAPAATPSRAALDLPPASARTQPYAPRAPPLP